MGLEQCGLDMNASRRELKAHGTLDFPCAGYLEHYGNAPGEGIPWHWHDEIEVIYVSSGTLNVHVPGSSYLLSAGGCLAVSSGVLHSAEAKPQCKLRCLVFSPLLITGSQDSVYAKKYLNPLLSNPAFRAYVFDSDTESMPIRDFTEAFDALASDAPDFEFTVREHLSSLCCFLSHSFKHNPEAAPAGRSEDNVRLQKMIGYIQEHYTEDISLEQVAGAADIGERECLRCFKRTIQLSPMQYLLKYRIMQGADCLLAAPSDSISEISIACGFESPSNFSMLFKRFLGCTPREYRNSRSTDGSAHHISGFPPSRSASGSRLVSSAGFQIFPSHEKEHMQSEAWLLPQTAAF
ncbi:MAG: helix-turn-helix domain-containing protein [Lachnospiraceae bacterium]|nr:helix-turn-helix domain-containing protein [Lachnospiraceae bacterium]MCI1726329.1 helix-turn-helix domain-containing protein [Lachnospiraceae bacterium]